MAYVQHMYLGIPWYTLVYLSIPWDTLGVGFQQATFVAQDWPHGRFFRPQAGKMSRHVLRRVHFLKTHSDDVDTVHIFMENSYVCCCDMAFLSNIHIHS